MTLFFREEPYIAASDSLGCVSLIKVGSPEKQLELQRSWQAHDFEAWITAFNQWDTNILYTGLYIYTIIVSFYCSEIILTWILTKHITCKLYFANAEIKRQISCAVNA